MSQQLWEGKGPTKFLWLLQALGSPWQLLLTLFTWHLHSILYFTAPGYARSLHLVGEVQHGSLCGISEWNRAPTLSCSSQVYTLSFVTHRCEAAEEDGSYAAVLHQLLSSPLPCCNPSQQMERGIILGRRASEGAHSRLKTTLQVQSKLQEAEKRRKVIPSSNSFSPVRHPS